MEQSLPLHESSIYQIYFESQDIITYQIPVYQRNYAWEEDEITALVKDVHDSFCKNNSKPYYIGTLVTYKRGDNNFEVIDGQQRLTTIYIILKALGFENVRNKLTYTARRVSANTIKHLPDFGEEYDCGIRNGFSYALKALDINIEINHLEDFKQYFLHNVHIIHYQVPKDVDLNHYFEVMNSRGEQLEKPEIVKSTLSWYLNGNDELAKFSRIWEACSEMDVYVQQSFPDIAIFGSKLNDFLIYDFEDIPQQEPAAGKESILTLINGADTKGDDFSAQSITDKFQPIIDFPNFLLQVLKLTLFMDYNRGVSDFTLDDKDLLVEFNKALETVPNKNKFVKQFAFNLLFAKYLLDNYMVHHADDSKERTGENPWILQYFYQENTSKRYTKNLSENLDVQKELVNLLSMFEVSFTPKQRKNYLFYCLVYLFGNMNVEKYLDFMRNLADKYFYDVYLNRRWLSERNQPVPNAFDKVILGYNNVNVNLQQNKELLTKTLFEDVYKDGDNKIPLYVFNYTDYRLWKKYAEELKGNKTTKGSASRKQFFEDLGCSDFELDVFKDFYFSRTRKSLEHYYPQSKAVRDDIAKENDLSTTQINCFGNFAMIGADANSSGSNWDPKTKLDHYSDTKSDPISVASLKFKIMMQMCSDNIKEGLTDETKERPVGKEWNYDDIRMHQNKILQIIMVPTQPCYRMMI